MCYSQPLQDKPELMYTVVLVHKGVYSNSVEYSIDFVHFSVPVSFLMLLFLS